MHQDFQPAVYLLANRKNGAIYTGVTSNQLQRIHQHREGTFDGFTRQHAIKRLVRFEQHATMSTRSSARSGSGRGSAGGRWS